MKPLFSTLLTTGLLLSATPLLAESTTEATFEASTNLNSELLDMTLADLGGIPEGQSHWVDTGLSEQLGYDLDKHFEAGESFSDIFTLGDMEGAGMGDLSINNIEDLSKVTVKNLAIDSFTHVSDQSIETLVDAVPGLGDLELGAVQPLANLVDSQLKGYGEKKLKEFASKKIKDLLGEKAIADLPISDIPNISELSIDSLPGVADAALKKFAGWKGLKVKNVPGLDQVPLSALGLLQSSPLAKLDIVFGPKEANVTFQPISGSDKVGFQYPCNQTSCAYIELTANNHEGDRWIKGGKEDNGGQMVPGGSGLLGKMFGGKEPTGRQLGKYFKLILMDTDEASGTAQFGLSTRFCNNSLLGKEECTPFIFGPWPVLQASEGDTIFLGFEATPQGDDLEIDVPEEIQEQIKAAKKKAGIDDGGSTASGSSIQEDCAKKVLQAVPTEHRTRAQLLVSDLMQQASDLKLTDSQTAYAIAWALENFEASNVKPVASKHGHRQALIASRSDLTTLSKAGPNGRDEYLAPDAADAWLEMQSAARAQGIYLSLGDSHRTHDDQARLWSNQIQRRGSESEAAKWSAPPGYSEHHTGYAIDIAGDGPGGLMSAGTPEANWVKANAKSYGWEVSFEQGNSQGVSYEPWHLRFVTPQSKSMLGLAGRTAGADISQIVPQLKQYITSSKADFYGLGKALGESDASALANRASNYQAILKECFFGGSCGGGKMQRPSNGMVTSEMGGRVHPLYGTWRLHAGIDVSAGMGAPVLAADCGKAAFVGWESGYGNVVVMDHGNNVFTRYAHLAKQKVKEGQTIKKGQLIADEGSTGGSTGPHLHFEVRKGGRFGEPQNPRNYVAF